MREKLISRVSRIISGSVHSLVDAIESSAPETVMSEAIREIDSALDDIRAELGQVVAKKHLANTRLMEENRKHEEMSEKIELAINEKRDDLAEAAVAKQLDIEARIPVLELTIKDCKEQEKDLDSYIHALQAKKREMLEELKVFKENMNERTGIIEKTIYKDKSGEVERKVAKAESAFERVVEKNTGIPGKNVVSERKTASQLAELEQIARENRIKERLAAIKGEIGKK